MSYAAPLPQRPKPRPRPAFWVLLVLVLAAVSLGGWAVQRLVLAAPRPITVLVMGVDNDGTRSDTMLLSHYEPRYQQVNVISLPRDSRVEIPGRKGFDKLNHAHAYGGPELAVKTVAQFLAVPVDYYIEVNFQVFKEIVDTVGGVTLDVDYRMYYVDPYQNLKIDLQPGSQVLNGDKALQYVRYRGDTGDIGRMERQQKFLRALLNAVKQNGKVGKIPALAQALYRHVKTDMPAGVALTYAKTAVAFAGKGSLQAAGLVGSDRIEDGVWYWVVDAAKAKELVQRMVLAPQPPVEKAS